MSNAPPLSPSGLGGALEHAHQPPGLAPRETAALGDRHEVALAGFALLVVGEQLARAAHVFAVLGMTLEPLDRDRDRLLHLVADHAPGQGALLCRAGTRIRRSLLVHRCSPLLAAARAFSPSTVFTRATLRRTLPNWSGRAEAPEACAMRRLNCSRRSLRSSS